MSLARFARLLPALPALLLLCLMPARPTSALPAVVTYTGQLLTPSGPAVSDHHYDLQFSLWNASSYGTQVGSTITVTNVPVISGVFYVELNFGSAVNGQNLWIQTAYSIATQNSYTTQPTRKLLPDSPYADYAVNAGNAATANFVFNAGNTYRLQGNQISATAPTANQVLEWNNGTHLWTPTTFAGGTAYTAGAGLMLSGTTFSIANGGVTSAMLHAGSVTAPALALPLSLTSASSSPVVSLNNTSSGGDGMDANTAGGYGVYASASNGYGLYGFSNSGVGVAAETNGGTALSSVNYGDGPGGSFSAEGNGPGVSAYSNGTSVNNPALLAQNGSSNGIGIYSLTNSTDANLVLSNGGTGDLIKAFNGGNNLYFEVKANGTTIVRQLQITGGADVAEPYTVAAVNSITPQPGMVVAIDPAHVGQMTLACKAYDRAVAGILSGGGGIQPGLTLRQKDTVADGTLPVACTGRVWCFCDADAGGAITAGDLLTTSATPGHAMKAADESRSRGAILGKAMSSLPSGKGLVLVLVTLQ